jgi:hypothetical protein
MQFDCSPIMLDFHNVMHLRWWNLSLVVNNPCQAATYYISSTLISLKCPLISSLVHVQGRPEGQGERGNLPRPGVPAKGLRIK